jgi:hypothetical protein
LIYGGDSLVLATKKLFFNYQYPLDSNEVIIYSSLVLIMIILFRNLREVKLVLIMIILFRSLGEDNIIIIK